MAECSIGRDWIMVRLQRETHRALRGLAEMWDKQYSQGRTDVPHDPDRPLSIDAVIRELLRRDDDHRVRSRSNSRKPPAPGDDAAADGPWDRQGRAKGRKDG